MLAATQDARGSWKGDYGGPLFLLPMYVRPRALGRPPDAATRAGIVTYLRAHQNADGGWGLHVEAHSHVFTTALSTSRCGCSAFPPTTRAAARAGWFLPHGGPLASGSWGKFILAVLGLYDWGLASGSARAVAPPRGAAVAPVAALVPLPHGLPADGLALRPARHGARDAADRGLRSELYAEPYETVDWPGSARPVAADRRVHAADRVLSAANGALGALRALRHRRARASGRWRVVLDQISARRRGDQLHLHRARSTSCSTRSSGTSRAPAAPSSRRTSRGSPTTCGARRTA